MYLRACGKPPPCLTNLASLLRWSLAFIVIVLVAASAAAAVVVGVVIVILLVVLLVLAVVLGVVVVVWVVVVVVVVNLKIILVPVTGRSTTDSRIQTPLHPQWLRSNDVSAWLLNLSLFIIERGGVRNIASHTLNNTFTYRGKLRQIFKFQILKQFTNNSGTMSLLDCWAWVCLL